MKVPEWERNVGTSGFIGLTYIGGVRTGKYKDENPFLPLVTYSTLSEKFISGTLYILTGLQSWQKVHTKGGGELMRFQMLSTLSWHIFQSCFVHPVR